MPRCPRRASRSSPPENRVRIDRMRLASLEHAIALGPRDLSVGYHRNADAGHIVGRHALRQRPRLHRLARNLRAHQEAVLDLCNVGIDRGGRRLWRAARRHPCERRQPERKPPHAVPPEQSKEHHRPAPCLRKLNLSTSKGVGAGRSARFQEFIARAIAVHSSLASRMPARLCSNCLRLRNW